MKPVFPVGPGCLAAGNNFYAGFIRPHEINNDANDNLTKITDPGSNETVYAYDDAGNIISDGIFTFVYNQNSRLVKAQKGSLIIGEYFYDGFGRRVKKVASGKTIHYHSSSSRRMLNP